MHADVRVSNIDDVMVDYGGYIVLYTQQAQQSARDSVNISDFGVGDHAVHRVAAGVQAEQDGRLPAVHKRHPALCCRDCLDGVFHHRVHLAADGVAGEDSQCEKCMPAHPSECARGR